MISIRAVVTDSEEIDIVRSLFLEYAEELGENLNFQSFSQELRNPLIKYGEPNGTILLGYWNEEVAGCIALQPLGDKTGCEMKRMYVRKQFRNKGIGDKLIQNLLDQAARKGYKKMVLDTLEKLHAAKGLYIRHGFVNIQPYYNNPLQHVIYMEKDLGR